VAVPVLSEPYATHRQDAVPLHLEEMCKQLGGVITSKGVDLNDDAPLAAIRKAITG
jgi:hypothetical protein